jgi:hypothetical protein
MSKQSSTNNLSLEDKDFHYLPPSIRCQPIIDHLNIQYHDKNYSLPIELFEDTEYRFGIFNLQIRGEIPITKKHLHIFFTIDSTGSMQDPCSDGRNKMQHILHTLENMIHIFHETANCEISVHVQSFDTKIYEIISNIENIHTADIDLLVQKIKKIRPLGSTNIECALKSASLQIAKYKTEHPNHEIAHVFLTDGEITDGSQDVKVLQSLVPIDCTNIFIGYGIHHDSLLLSNLATNKNNEYRFIDVLEKSGLVYGEVIHGLLYKAIEDVVLQSFGCEIYDYSTNTWTSSLAIGNLLSEQKKIYHIRSKTPLESYIKVIGKTIVQTHQFQVFTEDLELQAECHYLPMRFTNLNHGSESQEIEDQEKEKEDKVLGTNLVNFVLRQRTQELLFEARKLSEKFKLNGFNSFKFACYAEDPYAVENYAEENKAMKSKLKKFHVLLLKYIKDNQLEADPFLKTLCDDIYISNQTAGTPYGTMFTAARQTSQGRQQTYNCSNIGELNRNFIRATRFRKDRNNNNNPVDVDENIDNYIVSHDALSPYSTLGVVSVMRGVSGDDSIGIQDFTLETPATPTPTLNLDSP